jgi:uncharacterized membrane protein YdbT with pleckstrin-like domain
MEEQERPLKVGKMDEVDADERCIGIVRKHVFGLLLIYVVAALGLVIALGLICFLVSGVGTQNSTKVYEIVSFFAVMAIGLTALILVAITYVYHQNKLVITDKNLTEVSQYSLFGRRTTQLALANVEDVTADQNGVLAHIFGFGILKVETAGEHPNFNFTYCPRPTYYAKEILEAREKFIVHPG